MSLIIGKYFSVYQIRHNILGFTDGEIKEQDQVKSLTRRNVGIIPDPNAQLGAENEEEMAEGGQPVDMEGGQVPADMDLSGDSEQGLPNTEELPGDGGRINTV